MSILIPHSPLCPFCGHMVTVTDRPSYEERQRYPTAQRICPGCKARMQFAGEGERYSEWSSRSRSEYLVQELSHRLVRASMEAESAEAECFYRALGAGEGSGQPLFPFNSEGELNHLRDSLKRRNRQIRDLRRQLRK